MYTGALQAFGLMIGRTLGIAPGVTLRKTYTGINGQSSTVNQTGCIADAIETHDFINSMVDITADEETPETTSTEAAVDTRAPSVECAALRARLTIVQKEFNGYIIA